MKKKFSSCYKIGQYVHKVTKLQFLFTFQIHTTGQYLPDGCSVTVQCIWHMDNSSTWGEYSNQNGLSDTSSSDPA